MAVKLEGHINRYIGLSTDRKPTRDSHSDLLLEDGKLLPAGSSFFETDTWKIARFNGETWQYERTDNLIAEKLDLILHELQELRKFHAEVVSEF